MGWKKLFVGEKMPDKDDPKYRQRYEDEVNAGRKFAKMTKIDKVAGKVQHFANGHTRLFLALVFGFIILCFGMNIYRMVTVYNHQGECSSATERQEQMIKQRHSRVRKAISNAHCMPPNINREIQENNNLNKEKNGRIEED